MPNKKKEIRSTDEATAFLIEMGVSEAKAKARAKSLPSMNVNGESLFTFAGSAYRPDLFRYSVVSSDKQQRDLERKGFTRLPDEADVYQIGVGAGRIMVRDVELDRKAKADRAKRDYDRRNAKNKKSGGVLDQETGARFDITSNASPAIATEGVY